MSKRIRIEADTDSLYLKDNQIHAIVDKYEYIYNISAVERIVLLTTDEGPLCDDMCLAVDVGGDVAILVMSEHKCYHNFLFDQIGNVLPLDYNKIIDAASSVDDAVFEIYKKEVSNG